MLLARAGLTVVRAMLPTTIKFWAMFQTPILQARYERQKLQRQRQGIISP
jgi:hypothetical protein